MQFAVVNEERREAAPELSGECLACGKPVVAKCGPIRVWHWAHRGKRICDPWWEIETPWHRLWKSGFPSGWREVIAQDGSGERHIADVKTPNGLCIEFQHSHLRQHERAAREAFYCPNLVWIVDGMRLKRDLQRFLKGQQCFQRISKRPIFLVPFPNECFPQDWLNCRALVFFDFQGTSETGTEDAILWGLLPGRVEGRAVVVRMARGKFIGAAHQRLEIIPARWLARIATVLQQHREEMANARRPFLSWRPTWGTMNRWPRKRRMARF